MKYSTIEILEKIKEINALNGETALDNYYDKIDYDVIEGFELQLQEADVHDQIMEDLEADEFYIMIAYPLVDSDDFISVIVDHNNDGYYVSIHEESGDIHFIGEYHF